MSPTKPGASSLVPSPTGGPVEAKLVCSAGPAQGSEYPLRGEEAVIGRAAENAVSVPDTSVSRRHVQLTRAVDGWRAKDLGSGNGTLLNGEKLETESPLRNGDSLTLGNTQLSFHDMANSTDRVSVPPRPVIPRRPTSGLRPDMRPRVSRQLPATRTRAGTRGLRIALMAALLAFAAAGVGLLHLKKLRDARNNTVELTRQELERRQALTAATMRAGQDAARDGDWKLALSKFKEVQKQSPGFPELQAYLERAPKELEVQRKLDGAEAALAHGKLGEASEWLAQANTDGSLYNPRLNQLQASLERRLDPRLAECKAVLADGDLDKAHTLVADLVKAAPDNRDAQVLAQQVEDALAKKNHVTPRIVVSPHPAPEVHVWEPAVQRFLEGDVAGATALANGCASTAARCREMLRDLTEFNDLHRKMDDLEPKGLKRLVALDRELGEGKSSKLVRGASLKLANALYKQASAAKTSGDLARAKELAHQVLVLDPGNQGAQAIQDEASRMSKELYLHAYSVQDSNPDESIKICHEVVEMTPADDEVHKKALKLLEKLQR